MRANLEGTERQCWRALLKGCKLSPVDHCSTAACGVVTAASRHLRQEPLPAMISPPPSVHGSDLASYASSAQLPHALGAQSITTPVMCAAWAFLAMIPSTKRMLPCIMHAILRATFSTQPIHSPQRCLFMVIPCNARSPSDGEGVCLPERTLLSSRAAVRSER